MRSQRFTLVLLAGAAIVVARAANLDATPLLGLSRSGAGSTLYDIDPGTGTASNPRILTYGDQVGMAFSLQGVLYALSDHAGAPPETLFTIDPASGNMSVIGPTGLTATTEGDLDLEPTTGTLYHVRFARPGTQSSSRLHTIDTSDGSATIVGDIIGANVSAMAFNAQGTLFALDYQNNRLLTIDPLTAGILTSVALTIPLSYYVGMDFDPATDTLYVADGFNEPAIGTLYTLDAQTGLLSPVGSTGVAYGLTGLAFVPEAPTISFLVLSSLVFARRHPR